MTGFAKAYRKEKPGVLVKAVDFAAQPQDRRARRSAARGDVARPWLRRGGVRRRSALGRRPGRAAVRQRRWTASRSERRPCSWSPGAAGSIVSAITADLAAASGGTFHLLDLTPTPDPSDVDLARYVTDRETGSSCDLAARLRERGERATPVAIDKELAGLERRSAALAAVQAVEQAGGRAYYHSVDLTDGEAVAKVIAEVRAVSERIDVLLHAAGLEISHALPDKEPEEFERVFGVKADSWFNVLHAAGDLPIGATVVFSSVAGRFGNAGQTDYSAANDLLCKVTSSLRRSRPDVRAIALDWTAWGGIGMATRGSIPKVMAAAGVELLPPEAGVAWIRRELTSGADRGEVVVAGTFGPDGGGAAPARRPGRHGLDGSRRRLHDRRRGRRASIVDWLVRTALDPAVQPFLYDHRIDGTAVLPGVMGLEAFAQAARLLAPGWHVVAVEDVDFRAPVKFYRDEPRTLTVTALVRPDGDDLVAECRLEAERVLRRGGRSTADGSLHRHGPAGAPGAGRRAVGRTVRAPVRPCPRRRLPALLPRPGLPGGRRGLAVRRRAPPPGSPADLPADRDAGGRTLGARSAADRAVLPDGRSVGGREVRPTRAAVAP